MKRHTILGTTIVLLMLLLITYSAATVRAEDSGDDDGTAETDDDKEHEPEEYRDTDGHVWIQTDIITVRLDPDIPSFQYWYSDDDNGSLARFSASYLMVVEFEDLNSDGVYQPNETLAFVPLDAFEWTIQTGNISDSLGRNTEVYASYTKGGLGHDGFEDDWFEDWIPGYGEDEDNEPFLTSEDDGDLDLSVFEGMTLQFYAHMYMNDYVDNVTDDEGIQANYTIQGGVELKVDIEIGNFPFISDTSKIAILNYIREDLASSEDSSYEIRLHEEDGNDDRNSEDVMDNLGEKFHDKDDNHTQELSLVDADANSTRGFYHWVDKAVISLPNGTDYAVDVHASYWTDGSALLLFLAYPNFDGGSLLHDPSMGLVESANPLGGEPTVGIPIEAIAVIIVVLVAVVGLGAIGKRK